MYPNRRLKKPEARVDSVEALDAHLGEARAISDVTLWWDFIPTVPIPGPLPAADRAIRLATPRPGLDDLTASARANRASGRLQLDPRPVPFRSPVRIHVGRVHLQHLSEPASEEGRLGRLALAA